MNEREFDLTTKIKTLICYAHVFDCPLSENELFCLCNNYKKVEVKKILTNLKINNNIIMKDGHIILKSYNFKNILKTRQKRLSNSKKIIDENKTILKILSKIPFILMIGISGSVAHHNTLDKDKYSSDLDLFIVNKKYSLHLTRFIILIIRRLSTLLNFVGLSKKRITIDPNFGLEADDLSVNIKSFFTAYEASSVKVLKGQSIYNFFVNENKWIYKYLNPKQIGEQNNIYLELDPNASFAVRVLNCFCFLFFLAFNHSKHLLFGNKKTYSFKDNYNCTIGRIQHADGGYQNHIASKLEKIYSAEFGKDQTLHCFLFPKINNSNNLKNNHKDIHLTNSLNYD
tara:strand:- start:127 stop:1152 length:1026 start_codon:yes stop_codon:yes gene_type:complete